MRFYNVVFLMNQKPIRSVISYGMSRAEAYEVAEEMYRAKGWTFKYNDMCLGGAV